MLENEEGADYYERQVPFSLPWEKAPFCLIGLNRFVRPNPEDSPRCAPSKALGVGCKPSVKLRPEIVPQGTSGGRTIMMIRSTGGKEIAGPGICFA